MNILVHSRADRHTGPVPNRGCLTRKEGGHTSFGASVHKERAMLAAQCADSASRSSTWLLRLAAEAPSSGTRDMEASAEQAAS
jgi:hypothetical protein